MKKKNIGAASVAFLLTAVCAFALREQFVRLYYYMALPNLTVTTPNLSEIKDGSYQGEYDGHFVYVKTTVVVKNHQITEIILNEHNHQRGITAEVIPDIIIRAQSLDVDAVSGATQSSNVIRKAVENALKNASSSS